MLLAGSLACAGDWPAFRGPRGDGIAEQTNPPLHWSTEKNVQWHIALPGTGNGSPIVLKDSVLVACATELGQQRGLYCFERSTGRLRWRQTVPVAKIELTHKDSPYCASTPASDGKVVVVWHGTGGLHCYSLDGQPLWSRDFGEVRHLWGYGNSPVIHRDRVILHCGMGAAMFVVAVRLMDGTVLWRFQEPGGQTNETPDGKLTGSWATPLLTQVNGQPQIICAMPTRVVALDADKGQLVWSCQGLSSERGDLVYASPVVGESIVVVMAGYMGPAVGIRLDGSGDVTRTHRIWHTPEPAPQRIGSGVVVNNHIYLANADAGTIQCLELHTGKQRWRQRVSGGPHWASTLYANGLLYATNQEGITRIFRPNPDRFELVAENRLEATINATPAFADNQIFLRTEQHLYCIARPVK
jgi:outer membrane protein assembly factor BamB